MAALAPVKRNQQLKVVRGNDRPVGKRVCTPQQAPLAHPPHDAHCLRDRSRPVPRSKQALIWAQRVVEDRAQPSGAPSRPSAMSRLIVMLAFSMVHTASASPLRGRRAQVHGRHMKHCPPARV